MSIPFGIPVTLVAPTLESRIKEEIEIRVADIHTAMPATVLTFDRANGQVAVQPALLQVFLKPDGTEEETMPPVLKEVPVYFPRGGGFRMTWDINPGDVVLLLFCERSIADWSKIGGTISPKPRRKHQWSDAVAIAGLAPELDAIRDILPGQLVIGAESGEAEIRLDLTTGTVTVEALSIKLGADATVAASGVGDQIQITQSSDPAFFNWLGLLAAAASTPGLTPPVVPPYTAPITGRIISGARKVTIE